MRTLSPSSRRGLFNWSTREILLIAAIGIVSGLIFAASYYVYALTVVFGPLVSWAWTGLYLLPSFFIGYVMRRPGAALLIAIIYSLINLLFSPYGPIILISCAFYAISGETGIALGTRYRSFALPWMIIAGIIGGLMQVLLFIIFYSSDFFSVSVPIIIGEVCATIITATIAAVIGKQLADALARTGALAGTALSIDETPEV
ncbi:hypothetical protein EPA93_02120 [Ktedonosporobacter rubrisoli]|uniref:Uncharacterized protein n=1 Tax=Ktedonosporobacter rubrisoli TaxID=2509675 RepID=A0A4P6JIN4_KTERU|nr:ECF transporter S component [Ktedonosporobacter rubrisoli]QBD74853.1 hypothetical protein EPA93_02120 [Ktedonosporobacter rubrisoli]